MDFFFQSSVNTFPNVVQEVYLTVCEIERLAYSTLVFFYLFYFFPDLIVKVIQQNMGGIKIEEWRKVRFI